MLERRWRIALVLICLAGVAGFVSYAASRLFDGAAAPIHQNIGGAHSPTTHPIEWQLSEQRRSELIVALGQVSIGDTKEGVLGVLGTPDVDRVLKPKGIEVQPHGTLVGYQFRRYEIGLVNERWDQYVYLSFDREGQLREIFSTVPEVKNRGAMIRRADE